LAKGAIFQRARSRAEDSHMAVLSLSAFLFSSHLLVAVADDLPNLNVTPGCRQAATVSSASMESCLRDEQAARATLAKSWAQFAAPDKRSCISETTMGGAPSYVELLTCLQMAADARKLPADKTDGMRP